ncbi:putative secreted protein (Por secretion system target) [Ulvibacter sp. MAR_2010_11]|uniref:T9SS type A sorting domain-containing protein n=1 Tax=Ulvibacter sp. MAR_2010_11 TaxID=1250229 RepID=UPI000C2C35AB|nr:T9SS type A sorting domain-containing protein [Ulvibacter sp. MAR_2010_11]PKA82385.1 putative secreted protein (Por secretion system target) [Ulvibacter sp. MAR_2010_11]
MKRTLLFSFLFLLSFVSFSQGVNGDIPFSWELNLSANIDPIVLPPLDLEAIHVQDSINDLDKSIPWRYGIARPLTVNLQEEGVWTNLPNNRGRIWRAAIKSSDAINISVNFDDFYLPSGGRLFLYNNDRTDISKPYTHSSNRANKQLGSWFVTGDYIWLEYYEPLYTAEQVELVVGTIIHGYRMNLVNDIVTGGSETRGMNDSGACNYDVNCSIGPDFDEMKDVLKKAVNILNLGNGYLCSASLVNNTAGDKKPYLLTANHCLENSDPALWSIRFNWISPTPVCGTGEDSADLQTNFTMSGAQLRANNAKSDFALVELFNSIPESWDIAFAGWDNSDALPEFEVGIHHPNGDIMKICRDDSGAVKETAGDVDVWLIGGVSIGTGNGWEIGTTESGSSGSPLFNEDGKIIGQLYAGQSTCNGTSNNGDYDIYGRFGVSWNAGTTPETRLKDWLDPINTGQTTVGTLQNILNIPDIEINGTLDIFPNPASTYITVMNSRYPNLSYSLYNLVGQQLMSGSVSNTMNTIMVDRYSKGIYFLRLVDEETQSEITKKIIIDR